MHADDASGLVHDRAGEIDSFHWDFLRLTRRHGIHRVAIGDFWTRQSYFLLFRQPLVLSCVPSICGSKSRRCKCARMLSLTDSASCEPFRAARPGVKSLSSNTMTCVVPARSTGMPQALCVRTITFILSASGDGRVWNASSVTKASCGPNISCIILATMFCCVNEQWFSSERIRG